MPANSQPTGTPKVYVIEMKGPIGPVLSDFFVNSLKKAQKDPNTKLFIITLDTPGGLDTAMRDIIQRILASPIPVATYVSPNGARAASAGTYILFASHIAAMAPATNLGAATPIQLGGMPGVPAQPEKPGEGDTNNKNDTSKMIKPNMEDKMLHDAVAYIKALSAYHGRNTKWAEKAVSEAASLPAKEALKLNVIDVMADNIPDLLKKIDGKVVNTIDGRVTLNLKGAVIEDINPDWSTKFLSVITHPNVAYILLLIGLYGLIFEFMNPGSVVPGVIGAIALTMALFALSILPLNYAGLALLVLGLAFMVAEAFVPSFGILGIGGIISFVIGSIILFKDSSGAFGINWTIIAAFAASSALFFVFVIGMAVKARSRPVLGGVNDLQGKAGQIIDWSGTSGRVKLDGEIWNAKSKRELEKNNKVKVIRVEGLTLWIEKKEE
jgi:membrane-bound serine protease (ClpP class)